MVSSNVLLKSSGEEHKDVFLKLEQRVRYESLNLLLLFKTFLALLVVQRIRVPLHLLVHSNLFLH